MQNLYIVRTATVASLVAAMIGLGWMGMHDDDMQVPPQMVAVAGASAELGVYFPAEYELRASPDEREIVEYY